MGCVTLLLSGVPTYVTIVDLGYYLECLFTTNPEIGTFEVRNLPQENNKPLVALDFRSGFDAIAAQEQLDGYRYEMQDGTEYILHAKITKNKKYLRGDSSPEWSRRQSRSSSMENEAFSALALPTISSGAIFRANAMLDAKYKLLKKQKLIVETEMELIRERRKLRREYLHEGLFDSDDEPTHISSKPRSRSTSRERKSFLQELELYRIRRAAKIQELKAVESHAKESASISKLRSPQWDKDAEIQSGPSSQIQPKPNSRERSLRKCRSKSRVRSRAVRSRSLSRTSRKSNSRSRNSSPKTRRSRSRTSSSKTRRSRSQTSSTKSRRSRSLTPSPETRWTRTRRSRHYRSCSRDTESRDRTCKRVSKKRRQSKRLRSPMSGSRSRTSRPRNRPRLLAIMPKSPVKREPSISRSRANRSEVENSDIEIIITKKRTRYDNYSPKHESIALGRSTNKKTETALLKKNCNITSVTSTTIDNNVIFNTNTNKDKKIRLIQPATNINVHNYRNTSKLEDNKNMGSRSIKNNEKKIKKDTSKKVDSADKKEGFKHNPMKVKEESAHRKGVKSDETMIRLICNDIMFVMKSLLLKISIKENIIISDSIEKLLTDKLNILIHERVKILYADEKLSIYNALDIYRKICTEADDILLLKRMLNEIKTQETGTEETGTQNTLEKDANGNDLATSLNVKLDAVMNDGTEEYELRNKEQILEQTNLEIDKGNKTAEVTEVIDVDAYCPNESVITASKNNKNVPACPQFVLVVKRLMKQMKPAMKKCREKGVIVNFFYMKQVLKLLLPDILKGEGYKSTKEIIKFFRQKYPRDNDVEFVEKVAEDINTKKYDFEGVDKERQDNGDVILIETNPEIVTIEDSDNEPDEIRKEIMAVILSLDESTDNQKTNEACNYLSEKNIVDEAVNSKSDKKEEYHNIFRTRSDKTNEIVNTFDLIKSEKINEAEKNSNIEPTEICNTIVKQEKHQLGETVKNQKTANIYANSRNLEPKNADTSVNKEVQRTEIECSHINDDRREESLKVTAITIVTSESELHSIAHALENGDESPKQLKEEIEPEFTDTDIDKILSLEDFKLDMNIDGYNTSEACEKETPQVTAITIMTSASELLSLKMDANGDRVKEVPELKVESDDVDSATAVQVQSDEYVESKALYDINESVGNSTNFEIIRPESQNKRIIDNEEETIESICKLVESLCDEL